MTELMLEGDLAQQMTIVRWWAFTGYENCLESLKYYSPRQESNIWDMAKWSKQEFVRKALAAGMVDFQDAALELWLWKLNDAHPHKKLVTSLAMSLIAKDIWDAWQNDE